MANTKPNSEQTAVDALTASYRGFEVYYPKVIRRVSHAGRVRDVERPFLPRMIFVRDDGSRMHAVNSTPGISSVMRVGTEPALVRDWMLDEIRGREIAAPRPGKPDELGQYVDLGIRYIPGQCCNFKPGEEVRVIDGPFYGFNAIFEKSLDDVGRVGVALSLFGRYNYVCVDVDQLEKL